MSLNVVEGPAGGHDAYERAGDDLATPNYNNLPRVTGNLEGAVISEFIPLGFGPHCMSDSDSVIRAPVMRRRVHVG